MNYFEKTYLQKNTNTVSIKESKKLQKLLSVKALTNVDSKKLSTADLKRMAKLKTSPVAYFNVDSFISPFDMV